MEVPEAFYHKEKKAATATPISKLKDRLKFKHKTSRESKTTYEGNASIASKIKVLLVIAAIVLVLLHQPEDGNLLKSLSLPNSESEMRSVQSSSEYSLRSDGKKQESASAQQDRREVASENNADDKKQTPEAEPQTNQGDTELLLGQGKPQPEPEMNAVFQVPVQTTKGGLFYCGCDIFFLGKELFPDYWERYRSGYDGTSTQAMAAKGVGSPYMRPPIQDDILIYDLHGPCGAQPRSFPGKVLFVNGEPHGPNMPANVRLPGKQIGEDVYQIGMLTDSDHSIEAYHGAWNMMRLDEDLWENLFDHERKPKNTGKYNAVVYMNRQCVHHREEAVRRISNALPVHYGGRCNGNSPGNPRIQRMPNPPGGNHWTYNLDAYREYKFCLSMENSRPEHYMSEKILMAFHAGCIPIYFGPEEVLNVLNKEAFIWYDPNDPIPALRQIKYLSENEEAYMEMLNKPIMANGRETVKKYFSFSDKIEKGYLKNKLRRVMNLPVPLNWNDG